MTAFGRRMLEHWSLEAGLTYLNHGTVGVTPRRVLQAQQAIREETERQPARFQLRELTEIVVGMPRSQKPRLRLAADRVAEFLGARADDLVFVDNSTTGANAVLRSFAFRPGDEILITDLTYGGVARAARFAARERGAHVRVLEMPMPVRSPQEIVAAFAGALTERTRLAIVDHISSESALVHPLREIAALCRERGIAVLADGAHAPGAIPVDIPSLGVDWYVANLHKWAWAPRSSGILWAPPQRQEGLHPPVISWGLDEGFSAEFDLLGTRDASAHLAAPEAIAMMREFGVEAVQRYNHDLAWRSARSLAERWGTEFIASEALIGTMATVPLPAAAGSTREDAERLRDLLLFEDRIEVQVHSYRDALHARVSAQIYNDDSDVERLGEAVSRRAGVAATKSAEPRRARASGRLHFAIAAGLFLAGAFHAPAVSHAAPLDPRTRAAAERLIGAALASDHAMTRMSELCDGIGHRLSGSESLERAVRWAASAMREDGLENVRLQPVNVPHWVRGDESAVMVEPGPQKLSMLGLGRSAGTPPGGITAEVVRVRSFGELDSLPAVAVRGKIVLYDVPFTSYGQTVAYRGRGANRAAARGALAAFVRSVGPVSLRTPHTGAMSPYVDSIPKIPAAAVTIEDATMMSRLLARGVRVRVKLEMSARTLPEAVSHNVMGEIRGRERPDEVVVVGGHIDSWDVGQGAQDDGGGCVISMEALRLMKSLGLRPRRTVRCVLWTNEENGSAGGRAYADSLRAPRERHVAAIESDGGVERLSGFAAQVNRAGTDSVDVALTARAVAQLHEIAPLFAGLGGDRVRDGGGGTDIEPLMKHGVPGYAHQTTMEHYFDWHHTPSDMLDKVDPVELRKNVAALAAFVYVLAELPELPGAAATAHRAPAAVSRGAH